MDTNDKTNNKKWYVVYRNSLRTLNANKPLTTKSLLDESKITYFIPIMRRHKWVGDELIETEEELLRNLLFVQTEEDINALIARTDALKAPLIDCSTNLPAMVPDEEMACFMKLLSHNSEWGGVKILQSPFSSFIHHKKVAVTDGPFAGIEGYIVRIRRDRKLVISLCQLSVAISGIPHSFIKEIP